MVRVDLCMAPKEREARRPGYVAHGTSIDEDADWLLEL